MITNLSLEKRAKLAQEIYDMVFLQTESFEERFIIIDPDNDEQSCRSYFGKHFVGIDLAYLMAAILKNDFFQLEKDSIGDHALIDWLLEEYPDHNVVQFIKIED